MQEELLKKALIQPTSSSQDFLPAVCSMKLFDNDLVPHFATDTNTGLTYDKGKPLQTINELE